jgi:hypothetical protein
LLRGIFFACMRLGGIVKNAKDVLSSDAMSSSKNDAKKAAPIVDSLITDELGDYRAPLELLQDCAEQLAGLREAEARLLEEANRLELEREKALESAAEAEDPDVSELSRLKARVEVNGRKLSLVAAQIADAQEKLACELNTVLTHFGRLWRTFWLWTIEREKQRLLAGMVPGCPMLSLEQCAMHAKGVNAVRGLEITANDTEVLLQQAAKLLEAVSAEPDFSVPVFSPPAVSSDVAQIEPTGFPWDPGDGSVNIQDEVRKLLAKDPSLTEATIYVALKKKFPHLFKTRRQELSIGQEPLPAPETGVIAPPEPKWGRAPMIGDTVPG